MTFEWEKYQTDLPSVSDADLDFVEAKRRVNLPKGYRETVKQHCGDIPVLGVARVGIGSTPVSALFFVRYDYQGPRPILNMWYWIKEIEGYKETEGYYDSDTAGKFVPFASNSSHGIYAFDYRKGSNPAVAFLDLETALYDVENSIFPVAESWEDFLASLTDGDDD